MNTTDPTNTQSPPPTPAETPEIRTAMDNGYPQPCGCQIYETCEKCRPGGRPPPPAAGTPARTFDELLWQAGNALNRAESVCRVLRSAIVAAGGKPFGQPAPVAAGGAGQGERHWAIIHATRDGTGTRKLLHTTFWSREEAESEAREGKWDAAVVVPVLVTVLEGADGAGKAERGAEIIPGNDRGDYQIGELCGTWLHAHVTGSDADFLRAKFRSLFAAEGEATRLREALQGCVDVMDMQEKRESKAFHITGETMLGIWNDAKAWAGAALGPAWGSPPAGGAAGRDGGA